MALSPSTPYLHIAHPVRTYTNPPFAPSNVPHSTRARLCVGTDTHQQSCLAKSRLSGGGRGTTGSTYLTVGMDGPSSRTGSPEREREEGGAFVQTGEASAAGVVIESIHTHASLTHSLTHSPALLPQAVGVADSLAPAPRVPQGSNGGWRFIVSSSRCKEGERKKKGEVGEEEGGGGRTEGRKGRKKSKAEEGKKNFLGSSRQTNGCDGLLASRSSSTQADATG
ncbi:hypothetical protein GGS23DRAFT_285491 [Durotheca rogersii]|uniref:uncharacterized protein n=1 Tax=Durotheca rogersii TaxID=419775 RepID=UPI00221E6612|nr:uncharacterized protein GGS23DRAFT_285491 [Durotheca rogersii]KAI5866745.1 hypothetical protein GGS23DRAFT_285491 [Durotheca rogersii]